MKAEERERRQGSGNQGEATGESWRVDSGILSQCSVTCSGFLPQGVGFPPSSSPQALLAMFGSD